MKLILMALAGASFVTPAISQVVQTEPAAAAAQVASPVMVLAAQPTASMVLPQGTSVRLRTLTALSSNESRMGQRFDLETVDDVTVGGIVVIPRGSPAVGEVSFVKKKGMWGKSGRLQTSLISVRANGREIALRGGTANEKGDTGTAGVVASIVVIPIAGFFVTGTSAVLPMGTMANGMTVSDLPLALAAAPAPTTAPTVAVPAVPAAAPVLTVVSATPTR